MFKSTYVLCLLAASLLFNVAGVHATEIETRNLEFSKEGGSVQSKSKIKGNQIVDYKLLARSGQRISVSLKTSNNANYFNVMHADAQEEALFIGSRDGNRWEHVPSTDGEYIIRVYLMRSAARRGEIAHYTLTVATQDFSLSHDVKVKGTPFHATGKTQCALNASQGSSLCDFGVIRRGAGKAEVHLTLPNGQTRILNFNQAKVRSASDDKIEVRKSEDNWLIDINGTEHYRIPEAIITGG